MKEAAALMMQGKYEEALERYKLLNRQSPRDPRILINMANCLIRLKYDDKVIGGAFELAYKYGRDDPEVLNDVAAYKTAAGEFDEAEEIYQNALSMSPDNVTTWTNLAVLYLGQDKKIDEGLNILFAIHHAHPDEVGIMLLLGECYEEVRDYIMALHFYEMAIERNQMSAEAILGIKRLRPLCPSLPKEFPTIKYNKEHIRKMKELLTKEQ